MPDVPFFSFLEQVKTGKKAFPVTILYGFSEFLGQKIIRAFSDTFLVEKSEFNYRRYYFDSEYADTSWEEVISEANTSSFFVQSRKMIVVTIREEKKIGLQKYDLDLVKNYLQKPNPNTLLVIYISLDVIKDDFQQIKRQKISKLLKDLNSPHCYNINLDNISDAEVRRYIQSFLKDAGRTITASALDKIMEVKEEDSASVLKQLPMLEIAAVENESIDSEDIEKITSGVEAHSIWDLTDAIESEDAREYLKILKYLFINGIGAALIIGTLVTHYNKIYIAKFLLKQNFPAQEIGRALGQHPYFLNKFISSARHFSEKRLQHILRLIYDLDYESKTSGEESARLSLQNFAFRIKLLSHSSRGA
jgi:DNA polymerase-3 subunit delta